MTVSVISRKTVEFLKNIGFPEKSAVISFYTPEGKGKVYHKVFDALQAHREEKK